MASLRLTLLGGFEACDQAGRCIDIGSTKAEAILACLAQADRCEETRGAMSALRELQPNISIAWIEQHVPYTARAMPHFLDGMAKAGLQ